MEPLTKQEKLLLTSLLVVAVEAEADNGSQPKAAAMLDSIVKKLGLDAECRLLRKGPNVSDADFLDKLESRLKSEDIID